MADTLALDHLYDAVVARFIADAGAATPPTTAPTQPFGWRAPAQRPETLPRICWVPGDDQSGELGELGAARQPGRNPRPLATLGELVTVYVEAVDTTDPENERAQYRAARHLFDAWWRAVYLAARGTVRVRSTRWQQHDRAVRRYGATIRVLLELQAMVADAPYAEAPVDTDATVTSHLDPAPDDEGETDQVSAA